jgi:putative hydrolase of the HAD superfamily
MLEKVETLNDSITKLLNDLSIKPEEELVNELCNLLAESNKLAIPFPETLNVLRELKPKYKLGLITNTSYPSYKSLQDRYNVSDLFDVVVTSYDCKCIKPDGQIFNTALQKLGVEPGETLMVGDSLEDDILASRKLGMESLLIDRKNKYQEDIGNKITSLTEIATKV